MRTIIHHFATAMVVSLFAMASTTVAYTQDDGIFILRLNNIERDTFDAAAMTAFEYENFVEYYSKQFNFFNKKDVLEKATIYRVKHGLGVTNTTIKYLFWENNSHRFLKALGEYDYKIEPPLLLDILGTKLTTHMNAVTYQANKKEKTYAEEIDSFYTVVYNEFVQDIVQIQHLNYKMAEYYEGGDEEAQKKAIGYLYQIFDFQYYMYRMINVDEKQRFAISSQLHSLQKKAYKKLLELRRYDAKALKAMSTSKRYRLFRNRKEAKALLNQYLEEVGLEPLE